MLTEAAISGQKDNLMGLKENVIIGKLIPARAPIDLPPPPVKEIPLPESLSLEEGDLVEEDDEDEDGGIGRLLGALPLDEPEEPAESDEDADDAVDEIGEPSPEDLLADDDDDDAALDVEPPAADPDVREVAKGFVAEADQDEE